MHKKTCKYLNNVKHLLILTGCISISSFPSLVCVPADITSSAVGLKFVQPLQELKNAIQLSGK